MHRSFLVYPNYSFQRDINGLNMNISQLASVELTPAWFNESARQPYVRMYYIQSGHAEIHYRGKQIDLTPGNIYLIPSGLDYGYSCDDSCFKLFCHFTLLRYDHQDLFAKVNECIILENKMETVNEAIDCYNKADPESRVRLKMILFQSACEGILKSNLRFSDFVEYSPLVQDTIALIGRNCRITLTAGELAKMLSITPAALQKQFKREVGTPLGQYIRERVLFYAENDIRTTNRSIKEISEAYGFSDQFYFARVFRKYYHIQPSLCRKLKNT